jgi:hypothetical protein
VKAAILGTQHPDIHETEREILLDAGTEGFRRIAGYMPSKMPPDTPILPAMDEYFSCFSALVMKEICTLNIPNSNPRVSYLMVIWLLLGSDNPYCLKQYVPDDTRLREVARFFMGIALGDVLPNTPFRRSLFQFALQNWGAAAVGGWYIEWIHILVKTLARMIIPRKNLKESLANPQSIDFLSLRMALYPIFFRLEYLRETLFMCAKKWHDLSDSELLPIIAKLMPEMDYP